jgi:hypothetical protein
MDDTAMAIAFCLSGSAVRVTDGRGVPFAMLFPSDFSNDWV